MDADEFAWWIMACWNNRRRRRRKRKKKKKKKKQLRCSCVYLFSPIAASVFSLFPAATFKRSRLPPINQGLYSRIGVYFLHRTTHRLGSITLQPSYVSALLRRFTAMINSLRFARCWCISPPAGGRERGRE